MHSTGRRAALIFATLGVAIAQPAFAQSFLNNSSSHSSSSPSATILGSPSTTILGSPFTGLGSTTNGGLPMGGFGGTTFGTSTPGAYGISGVGPAPGVSSFSGVGMTPAQFSYYSNRHRLTNSNGLAPVAIGGGYYQLSGGDAYWLSPSGYYYPWGTSASGGYPTQVIYALQQGSMGVAKPPVATVITDLRKFLADAKSQQQLDLTNFESFSAKLTDIETRTANLAGNNGGVLDASDDISIRHELDSLITDIAQSLHN